MIDRLTKNILGLILPLLAFLLPLFFLPITTDFFTTNKQIILIVIASFALISWATQLLLHREPKITLTPATLPLLGLAVVIIVSGLLQSPNRLFSMSGQATNLLAFIFIFIAVTSLKNFNPSATISAFIVSLSINSLLVIYQFTGISGRLTNIEWLKTPSFNPVGGPLPFLTLAIPLFPAIIYLAFKSQNPLQKILLFVSSALTTLALIISVSLILPKDKIPQLTLLPFSAGWAISVDIFKNIRTALIGVGPENYGNAFTQLKPISINRSAFWNLRFSYSSNEYLNILTTLGVLGFAFYLLSLLRPLTLSLKKTFLTTLSPQSVAIRTIFGLSILVQLFVPANLVLMMIVFVSLALLCLDLKTRQPQSTGELSFSSENTRLNDSLTLIVFILCLVLVGANGFYRWNTYAAERNFFDSLIAANQNQGTQTYNLQINAIKFAPYDPKYRLAYSQTNLALANSIASKSNLSDQDKSNVAQLIQQAIREAKAGTTLDPQNSLAWQNLANVYRQLINVAQGSDQWAIAAYSQAITLDPLNPQTRVDLGGVYYSLKDFDQSIRLFQQAVEAKSDWPNAYYNLSHAYLMNKQYAQAIQSMRVVTQLIDPTSADFQKAQDELAKLEKDYPQATQQTQQTPQTQPTQTPELLAPSPLPSPSGTPIQLPDGSGLNLPPAEPTPTAP